MWQRCSPADIDVAALFWTALAGGHRCDSAVRRGSACAGRGGPAGGGTCGPRGGRGVVDPRAQEAGGTGEAAGRAGRRTGEPETDPGTRGCRYGSTKGSPVLVVR